MKRRHFLLGLGAAAAGTTWWLKPGDEGGPYSPYFASLNKELQDKRVSHPRMLIDLDRMDANIDEVRGSIRSPKTYRIVVKSLPSLPLLGYIMQRAHTNALMVFHQPFLNQVAAELSTADVLMGKPLPVAAARTFYQTLKHSGFDPRRQLQWLIDTGARLKEYQELARVLGVKMRVNLELDIGLHRGGFSDPEALTAALDIIAEDSQHLEFAGFMGYEAFITKLPNKSKTLRRAKESYHALIDAGKQHRPELFSGRLTFNIAGSQTYRMYEDDTFFNDICAGSGLVMPTDFDLPTLETHQPAAFIATPVLKHYDSVLISGLEKAAGLFSAWNPNRQQTFYTYGGYWKARCENPPGLRQNTLWGHSTNQDMVNASNKVKLGVGDFIFLRPTQSEFVFLQFGDLLTLRQGEIQDYWPVFKQTS